MWHVDDKLAKEVEVYFCSYLFINTFIDVIILIGRFALTLFEMLVELAAVFKKEMEDFANRVVDLSYTGISLRHLFIFKSFWPHKHTLQDVYDFDLELRIRYLLVYR